MKVMHVFSRAVLLLALATAAGCSGSGSPLDPASPLDTAGPLDPVSPPAAPAADLSPGEYVLVLNRGSADISVLSAADGYAEVRRISLPPVSGARPAGLAVDGAGRTIFVSFPDSLSTVLALGFDGSERARASVAGWSPDLALDPARGLLAVAEGDGVEFLDAATLARRARVPTGAGRRGAWHVALDPAAGLAAVSHSLLDEVALVSTTDYRLLGRLPVEAFPDAMTFLGGILYVAANDADRLDAVDVVEGRVVASIPTGNGPAGVVASPRLNRVFVADDFSGQVTAVEAGAASAAAQWSLGHSIPGIALNGAETLLFICNPFTDAVELLDAATGARAGSVSVGNLPGLLKVVDLR